MALAMAHSSELSAISVTTTFRGGCRPRLPPLQLPTFDSSFSDRSSESSCGDASAFPPLTTTSHRSDENDSLTTVFCSISSSDTDKPFARASESRTKHVKRQSSFESAISYSRSCFDYAVKTTSAFAGRFTELVSEC